MLVSAPSCSSIKVSPLTADWFHPSSLAGPCTISATLRGASSVEAAPQPVTAKASAASKETTSRQETNFFILSILLNIFYMAQYTMYLEPIIT